jgi:hypothetical protein
VTQSCATCRHFRPDTPVHELGKCHAGIPIWVYRWGPPDMPRSNTVRASEGESCKAYQPIPDAVKRPLTDGSGKGPESTTFHSHERLST